MLFNSLEFAIFLPIVFILYWFLLNRRTHLQNCLLIISSYIFYGWWDWRFLILIAISTLADFFIAKALFLSDNITRRKALLFLSITVNLGILGFFKYYNFFIDNFIAAFSFFGTKLSLSSIEIILPVGISFYTFQTLSYTIDVYKNKLRPDYNLVQFCAFVSFFPQLVAGPIERASNLLPQFSKKREFTYKSASNGLRQILWGFAKKLIIADNCAQLVDPIFSNHTDYPGSILILGAVFFAFQIYCDFSGYSDIAIGTARLFGFNLMQNFNFPYFSRDIAEFWRRWHISLSTWFRDYLYIPLGGNKGSKWKKLKNILIIFIVSGFWHGANWTFIIWGFINGIFFLPLLILNKNRNNLNTVAEGRNLPSLKELYQMGLTFLIVIFGWIFFRAENMDQAMSYLGRIFSQQLFILPRFKEEVYAIKVLIMICIFVVIEWKGRQELFALEIMKNVKNKTYRWSIYLALILVIYYVGVFKEVSFIYFQF